MKDDNELSDKTWEKVQDIEIEGEWKLIDDSADEWYCRPQILERCFLFKHVVIADSDKRTQNS